MARAQPIIQTAIAQKTERDSEITALLNQFADTPTTRSALLAFIAELEQNGISIRNDTSRTINTEELGVNGVVSQSATITMKADFLAYLRVRNKFVEAQSSISISEEFITADGTNPLVDVQVTLSIPSLS